MATRAFCLSLVAGRNTNAPSSYSSPCWVWRVRVPAICWLARWTGLDTVLLVVEAFDVGGQGDQFGGLRVAGPVAGLHAAGVEVPGRLIEESGDAPGLKVEAGDGDDVGRLFLLHDEPHGGVLVGVAEGLQAGAVPVVLLRVAVLPGVLLELLRLSRSGGLVVDGFAVVAPPVDPGPAGDAGSAVLPEDRLFGLAAVGFEERGGFGVAAQGVGHGHDLGVLVGLERDGAAGAGFGDLGFDGVGVPPRPVEDDEFGPVAEDDLVGGGAVVEDFLGRLAVEALVLELGGAARYEELAGAR